MEGKADNQGLRLVPILVGVGVVAASAILAKVQGYLVWWGVGV